jgi:phage-related tail fiber protein
MAEIITSITTNKARQKLARAHYSGSTVPKITMAGWGTGGVDINGDVIKPSSAAAQVAGEIIKNKIKTSTLSQDGLSVVFTAELMPGETGVLNQKISTVGLYDEEGDLVLVKNFTPKQMDADSKITIECTEEF